MKNNIVDPPEEYEEMINKLEKQITELFSELHYYQALLTEKENTIIRLTTENRYLKAKVQTASSELTAPPSPPQQSTPPSYRDQESLTPPPKPPKLKPTSYPNQELNIPTQVTKYSEPIKAPDEATRINKRVCPKCGAMGFAIKEVDDKSRIISYTPRRIYAKKYACTKCAYEWF